MSIEFNANQLLSDASELDNVIFKRGQSNIDRDLNEFVYEFETRQDITTLDSLAKSYVLLTSCGQKLKSIDNHDALATKLKTVQADLTLLLSSVQQTQAQKQTHIPFQQERSQYLQEKAERHKKMVSQLQREADKLDEFYSKKTRASIYRNLVGYHK